VLDEYAALLKKDKLPGAAKGNTIIDFTLPDQQRLQVLFNQMSKKQRDKQEVIFGPLLTLAEKPSDYVGRLSKWKDPAKYDIWVDGKRVNNSELANYKPSDFVLVERSRLVDDVDKDNYKPQIVLMTPPYYAKFREQLVKDKYQTPLVVDRSKSMAKVDQIKFLPPMGTPVPASKFDAPQNVLDEYADILKKYDLPTNDGDKVNFTPHFAMPDSSRLSILYGQMSKNQQWHQYVRFTRPFMPPAKSHPTDQQLSDWQDAVKYGVWIDDKRIKNTELGKYKATDFDLASVGRLTPIAVKNDKFHYQVELMTTAFYEKFRQEKLAQKDILAYVPKDEWVYFKK
jgi:hypothetical protein